MSYIGSAYHHYSTLPPHSEQNFCPCVTSAPQNLHFLLSEAGSSVLAEGVSAGETEGATGKPPIMPNIPNPSKPPGGVFLLPTV